MSLKGRISISIWCRNSVSPSMSPAKKAPKAIESWRWCVSHAAPSATNSAAIMNNSVEWDLATSWNNGLKSHCPIKPSKIQTPMPLPKAINNGMARELSPLSAKAGTIIKKRTAARSWNSKIPIERRPWVVCNSCCSANCLTTTAVDESARAPAATNAVLGSRPRYHPPTAATKVHVNTWIPPKPNKARFMVMIRVHENSSPMVNIKNTTPNSAKNVKSSKLGIKAKPPGPTIIPTNK